MLNPDENKDESYIRRRNWLLSRMKKTRWEEPEENLNISKKGRKPKEIPKPKLDLNNPRNKFFKFD